MVGVINVPVKIYKIQRSGRVHLTNLHAKDKGAVGHKNYCKVCKNEVAREEIVKGYKISKDKYVTFTQEEVEKIKSVVGGLQVKGVIDWFADHHLVETTYLLLPDKHGAKTYKLLQLALSRAGKCVVGSYSTHDVEHLAIIRPYNKLLLLDLIYFPEDVVDLSAIEAEDAEVTEKEVDLCTQLMEKLAGETDFDYHSQSSTLKQRLEEIIVSKLEGKEVVERKEPVVQENLEKVLKEALLK
jgi:DNA end-binding protein Ku